MNILVTGGMGFIGHNVVRQLQAHGHTVSILDNHTNYGVVPWPQLDHLIHQRHQQINKNTHVHKHDICDTLTVKQIFEFEQPDIVIHLASFPRQRVVNADPGRGSRVMSQALVDLLQVCSQHQVGKFVYISSSMVYGSFTGSIKEHAVCEPQGQYSILKLAGEWLVKDHAGRNNMAFTILRPSAVYGPLDVEDRVTSKFILNAMRGIPLTVNGVNELLDFTFVQDTVDGIVSATLSNNTDNKTYNITKSHGRSLLDAAQLVIEIVGRGSIIVADKDPNFPSRGTLNIDAARKDFGFDPKISIEQGFPIYHNWLKTSACFGVDNSLV